MRAATNSAATALSPADTETVKLLLVDDDRDTLLALQAILEPLNQELMLAESGKDALRMCLDHNIAAILLDVRMPEMDGFETAELIRSRKRSRHTPILFLTAYRSDEQLFRGYDLGAVDFLFKPIVPEILQSKVSVFVELSRSEQTLRRQAEEIARTEKRFRAVLEGAPDAMLITSGDGTIELANSRVDALFGHARTALIRENIRALIPGWGSDPNGGVAQAETRMTAVRQDGSSFPAQITCNPFITRGGRFLTTAIRDVTTRCARRPASSNLIWSWSKGSPNGQPRSPIERGFAPVRVGGRATTFRNLFARYCPIPSGWRKSARTRWARGKGKCCSRSFRQQVPALHRLFGSPAGIYPGRRIRGEQLDPGQLQRRGGNRNFEPAWNDRGVRRIHSVRAPTHHPGHRHHVGPIVPKSDQQRDQVPAFR